MYIRQTQVCLPLSPVIKDLNGSALTSIGLDVAKGNESRAILQENTHRHTEGRGWEGRGSRT